MIWLCLIVALQVMAALVSEAPCIKTRQKANEIMIARIDGVTLEKMIHNAGHGRGLWIGLDIEPSTHHEEAKRSLEMMNPEANGGITLLSKPQSEVHLTLAHLGRDNNANVVHAAIAACELVSGMTNEGAFSVEAVARMSRHVVAIVSPRWIDKICDDIDSALRDRHVSSDKTFVGIRHVTMAELKRGVDKVTIPYVMRHTLVTKKLIIVCGDARMESPLLPSVF